MKCLFAPLRSTAVLEFRILNDASFESGGRVYASYSSIVVVSRSFICVISHLIMGRIKGIKTAVFFDGLVKFKNFAGPKIIRQKIEKLFKVWKVLLKELIKLLIFDTPPQDFGQKSLSSGSRDWPSYRSWIFFLQQFICCNFKWPSKNRDLICTIW